MGKETLKNSNLINSINNVKNFRGNITLTAIEDNSSSDKSSQTDEHFFNANKIINNLFKPKIEVISLKALNKNSSSLTSSSESSETKELSKKIRNSIEETTSNINNNLLNLNNSIDKVAQLGNLKLINNQLSELTNFMNNNVDNSNMFVIDKKSTELLPLEVIIFKKDFEIRLSKSFY